jgi:hypothetical protein
MQTFIKRFVAGESGVSAYGLIAAALLLIGVGAWSVATAPRVVASTQIDPLEMMANARDLPSTQNGAGMGTQSATSGRAARNVAAAKVALQTSAWPHDGNNHHGKLYMSAKSTHKHKQSEPAPQVIIP